MKDKLIPRDAVRNLHPIFRGRFGDALLNFVFKFGGLDKVNAIYDGSKQYTGLEFVNDMLDKLGIIRKFDNYEVLDQFKEGPFITVSNHPIGHIDGIIAISAVAGKRRDYKMMVNWMLNQIDTMEEHFIGVNPYAKGNKMADLKSSVAGVKQCLEHLKNGHPLGLFPAGGVSTNHLTKTEDREWQPTVIRLIQKAKVPVIPMYIDGKNSWIYRTLGFISWKIRTVRLLHETTNKRGQTITVRFGNPISVEEQSKYKDVKELGEFLKSQTYALKKKK